MDFSYVIAYRHQPDRLKNLHTVLKWLSNFKCEVIIVENDVESKLDESKEDFKFVHIFLNNNLPFNKSWCFNVGYKNASNENVIFGDSDLIMDEKELLESVNLLRDYGCVNPYSSVIDLDSNETKLFIQNKLDLSKITRPGRGETDHQKVPMCGGIIFFTKSALDKVRGWDENFWGWGAEDDFMSKKVERFLMHKTLENKCYHLYHEKSIVYQDLYYRNISVYNQLNSLDGPNMERYLESTKDQIGLINKRIN